MLGILKELFYRFILGYNKFDGDKAIGKHFSFHPNGRLSFKGKYENNIKTGYWLFYKENGSVESEGVYRDGLEDGVWYFNNRTTEVDPFLKYTHGYYTYKKGVLHGETFLYNETVLVDVLNYNNGK